MSDKEEPTVIEYTLISRGKFAKTIPIRRDLHQRIKRVAKSMSVPVYRIADAFMELCVLRMEAGALEISPGTIPRRGKQDSALTGEHYDDEVILQAEKEVDEYQQTREYKLQARSMQIKSLNAPIKAKERKEEQKKRIAELNLEEDYE